VTGSHDEPDKLADVARLATAVAERILEQNEAGTTIPPEQFIMLVRAAKMLHDNNAPWPPSVEHVLMEVAKRVESALADPNVGPATTEGDDVVGYLMQVLHVMRRP
jgi:hypothetical protein